MSEAAEERLAEREAAEEPARARPVTLRAVLIGLALGLALGAITPTNDNVFHNTFLAGNHFPLGAFMALSFLALLGNQVLRLFRGRIPLLSRGELITVWCMLIASSGIPSSGLMRLLVPVPLGLRYFASAENNWFGPAEYGDKLYPRGISELYPDWVAMKDELAAEWFFEGLPEGEAIPWAAWLHLALGYSVVVAGIYLVSACLAALVRRQWVERERFPFPLIELPNELAASARTRGLPETFRSGFFWAAVIVVLVLRTMDGIHVYYPSAPYLPLQYNLAVLTRDPPLRYLGWLPCRLYPMMVGLTYFVNTEVSFSVWFFFWVVRVEHMIWGMLGLPAGTPMFVGQARYSFQQMGAHLGLAFWCLWVARGHISDVLRKVFCGAEDVDDAQEALPYRAAMFGLLLGIALLVGWMLAAGVELWIALGVVLGLCVSYLVMSWLVTHAGVMFVQTYYAWIDVPVGIGGSATVSPKGLAIAPLFELMFDRDLRECLMPSLLNGLRAADPTVSRRSMLGAMMLCVVAVTVLGWYMAVKVGYRWAANTLPDPWAYRVTPPMPYTHVDTVLRSGQEGDIVNMNYMLAGIAVVCGLFFLRTTFLWFPLHPAGFFLHKSYPGDLVWFSFFIGWLVKSVIQRFGGFRALRGARPAFLGLIFGDALAALLWIIVGWVVQDPDVGYRLLPG